LDIGQVYLNTTGLQHKSGYWNTDRFKQIVDDSNVYPKNMNH